MKFTIPENGKTLTVGKSLVQIKGGVFDTEDAALIKMLGNAHGVEVIKEQAAKPKSKQK